MSKRNLKVISVLLTLMLLGLFPGLPALAGSLDKEIGALKKALLELERRKNEEISELKKRIETLEKTRLEQAAPQKEAQEGKQSVATLKSKVDDLIEKHKLKAGLWLQTWYQFVQDGKGGGTKNLHDFMLRRFYFHLKGEILPKCGFFSYIAADRLGQAGLVFLGGQIHQGVPFFHPAAGLHQDAADPPRDLGGHLGQAPGDHRPQHGEFLGDALLLNRQDLAVDRAGFPGHRARGDLSPGEEPGQPEHEQQGPHHQHRQPGQLFPGSSFCHTAVFPLPFLPFLKEARGEF